MTAPVGREDESYMNIKTKAKRFLAALLIAALVCVPLTPAYAMSAGDFQDVRSSDWYYGAVDFAVSRGLFTGTSSTSFSPNGQMTRGMFITVLGRYAGVNASAWLSGTVTGSGVNLRSGPGTDSGIITTMAQGTDVTILGKSGGWYQVRTAAGTGYVSGDYMKPDRHSFSDVGYGQYYAGYAVWAYEKGIVNGDGSSDKFSPNSSITREQMCTMLSRFASVMGTSLAQSQSASSFVDGGSISSWAADSVSAMQRSGVVQGDGNGAFRPRGTATRAETATMLQRFESACGGFSAPNQDPPAKQNSQSGGSGNDNNNKTPETTPPSGSTTPPPSDGEYPADTPAALIGSTVPTKGSLIRVGLYYKTNSYDTSVDSVTLSCGSGFDIGSMPERSFSTDRTVSAGTASITLSGTTFTVSAGGESYTYEGSVALRPAGDARALTTVNGGYSYYGAFELRPAKNGKIDLINIVGIEDYVKGVLGSEFSGYWPAEALKAAAVACRSFGMQYDWSTYAGYGMDILSGSNCQVYRGRYGATDSTDAAADATRNLYLTYQGSICTTCYSSCNGGQIASGGAPYLQAKADPYEAKAAGEISDYSSWVNASHKMGMSAWGCYAMAKYFNKTYDVILGFYYTGTSLQYGA